MPLYEIFPLPPLWLVVPLNIHTYAFVFACFHMLPPYEIFPFPRAAGSGPHPHPPTQSGGMYIYNIYIIYTLYIHYIYIIFTNILEISYLYIHIPKINMHRIQISIYIHTSHTYIYKYISYIYICHIYIYNIYRNHVCITYIYIYIHT